MNKIRKSIVFMLIIAMIVTSGTFSGVSVSAAKKVKAKSISLNYKTKTLKVGGKVQLKAKVKPTKAKQKKVVWSTGNKKVATVSTKGLVKAKKKGTVKITAKVKGTKVKAVCKVTVKSTATIKVSTITLGAESVMIENGQTYQITSTVAPSNAKNKTLAYVSQDITVATVDSKGLLTAVGKGTTSIEVKAQDGSGVSATLIVTVKSTTTATSTPDSEVTAPTATAENTAAPVTQNQKPVYVTSIAAEPSSLIMQVNKTAELKATVSPSDATVKTLAYTSRNTSIVTVNSSGIVTSVAKGTTAIQISAQDGSGVSIEVPVSVVGSEIVVSSPEDVDDTLQTAVNSDGVVSTVRIATNDTTTFNIADADYSDINLVVDAPNADVNNHAKFKAVTINAIASDTYCEYAIGNKIDVNAPQSHIVIKDAATAEVNLNVVDSIKIEVDGTVTGLNISGASSDDSSVNISGENTDAIPVTVDTPVNIASHSLLNISATAKVALSLYAGAENTTVSVDTADNSPSVRGLGTVEVYITDENDIQTIIAEYAEEIGVSQDVVQFTGSILDMDSEPVSGASIGVVPYSSEFNIDTIESDANYKCMKTNQDGIYQMDSIRTGNYIMVVKADGMVTSVQNIVITSRYGTIFQNETLYLFPDTEGGEPGSITGVLSNSIDGEPISGLTVRLRSGRNNTVGTCLTKVVSGTDGNYTFDNVAPGYYTVEIVDLRTDDERGEGQGKYITTSVNTVVRSGQESVASTALTDSINNSQVRFVLTWGDEASGAVSDLDSHLTGPGADGTDSFHTYYSNKTYTENDVKYADLDWDDTTYEGPETTTIYKTCPGVYNFYVHNFTDRYSEPSSSMAASRPKVEVYRGATLMVTYYVPNESGTVWHVCSYDSTTNTFVQDNTMYYESSPENVGIDVFQSATYSLSNNLDELYRIINMLEDNDAKDALQQEYDKYAGYLSDAASVDMDTLYGYIESLRDLIYDTKNQTAIDEIVFGNDNNLYEIYEDDTMVYVYTYGDDSISISDVLTVDDGSTYTIQKDADGNETSITVTAASGLTKVYTIEHEVRTVSIKRVFSGDNTINFWQDVTEDGDGNISYELYVGTQDGSACDFTVQPYPLVDNIEYVKEDGIITSVDITYGTKTYAFKVNYYTADYTILGFLAASGNANTIQPQINYYSNEIDVYGSDEEMGALLVEVPAGYTYFISTDYEKSEDGGEFAIYVKDTDGQESCFSCTYHRLTV